MTTTIGSLFDLLRIYLQPQQRRVLVLIVLLALSIGLQLINPQIVRYVLDTAQSGTSLGALVGVALLFTLFGVGQKVASVFASYVGEDVSWTATNALRADLAAHCLRLDMGFHNAHTPGELIERVDGDVSELATFFSHLMLRVIANGLLILGVILLLFQEDWRMGLAGLLYAALLLYLLQVVQKRNVRLWGAARESLAGFNGFLEERLAGREDVRANGGEAYVLRGLALFQYNSFQAHYKARLFGAFMFGLTHMLFVLATALGLGMGIVLFINAQVTIGTVYLIVYYLAILREPLEQIRDQIRELQQSTASVQRIQELFARQPAVLDQGDSSFALAYVNEQKGLAVAFDAISFRYERMASKDVTEDVDEDEKGEKEDEAVAKRDVLDHVSFALEPGEILGLLGRTGSGKTTLTRLLFRLYEPTSGRILLGGTELSALSFRDTRRQIGMVTQDVQLFQASLRDNITMFNRGVEDDRILDVLYELGLGDWYEAQPDGLDTYLQSGGAGLSAGEAQLLAFVRVFLKDPGLVILDEASSRLDPATEQLLERATDRLLENRTGIIIAHRLSTVERANTILLLEQGRVAEYGPREKLATDQASHFYHLLQTGLAEENGGPHESR
ncbi:MAG: ABC transporter ATP-binding protein [Chloroflexota bacterium]